MSLPDRTCAKTLPDGSERESLALRGGLASQGADSLRLCRRLAEQRLSIPRNAPKNIHDSRYIPFARSFRRSPAKSKTHSAASEVGARA